MNVTICGGFIVKSSSHANFPKLFEETILHLIISTRRTLIDTKRVGDFVQRSRLFAQIGEKNFPKIPHQISSHRYSDYKDNYVTANHRIDVGY